MSCSKALLSNASDNSWVYFNFRRCDNSYIEDQFGIPPLGHREVIYENNTLVTAFKTNAQIDPGGRYSGGT